MTLFGDEPAVPMPKIEHHHRLFRGRWTLEELVEALPLHQNTVNMTKVPRLECWFGKRPYAFGGRVEEPHPWPAVLLNLLETVEQVTPVMGGRYDSCFANLYRDGNDSIAWHADDAPWIGEPIVSVSFGAARRFVMRDKATRKVKHEFMLGEGDLFVMHKGTQAAWEHAVPRTGDIVGPRLNLTFRSTVG